MADELAPGETRENPNPVSSFDKVEEVLTEVPVFEPTKVFKLRAPARFANDTFTSVTLRAPTGLDLMECGRPTYPTWRPDPTSKDKNATIMSIQRDPEAIRKMLQRLSDGKPMAFFYTIPAGNLNAMIQWIIDEVAEAGN